MAGTSSLTSALTVTSFLGQQAITCNTSVFPNPTPFKGFTVVISSGPVRVTYVIYQVQNINNLRGYYMQASGDAPTGTVMPIGSQVAFYAWLPIPVGNTPGRITRSLQTSFDKLAIREEFTFASPTGFDGTNIYTLPGPVWVKTQRGFFALPAALRAFMGDRASNTGAVKFWSGNQIKVSIAPQGVKIRCFRTQPAFVHQEQDMVNW